MKNRKAILLLVFAIVALAAANLMLKHYNENGMRPGMRPMLMELDGEMSSVTIERRGDHPIKLVKTANWRLTDPYPGSVDESVVMRFLDALATAPVKDVVSDANLLQLGHSREDFSLVEPLLRISLTNVDGLTESVAFGTPTPNGDGIYAVVGDLPLVFTVPTEVLAAVDITADKLRRRSLFILTPEFVTSFDIRSERGDINSFVHDANGWKVGNTRASDVKVKQFLSKILSASAESFLWPTGASNETEIATVSLLAGYGLDPESAVTITFKGADGNDRQISFGKSADETHVYALVQNAGAIVTVASGLKDAAGKESVMFTDSRLFPIDRKNVTSFTVTDGDIAYSLSGDDGNWRLESPIAAPADRQFVERMLDRILALSPADSDPMGVQVSIATNANPVQVSRRSVLGDAAGFEGLRSRQMLNIDARLVKRLVSVVGGKSKSVVYSRERRDWNVDGGDDGRAVGVVNADGVNTVLKALGPLTATKVVKIMVKAADLDDYALDKPFLTVSIDQDREGSVRRNVLVGGVAPDGGRFATIGSSDAVFVISDETVKALSAKIVGLTSH